MEELLARERAAEQHVHYLLRQVDEPLGNLLEALSEYRAACQAHIFADFENGGAEIEDKLWHAHTEARRFFHNHLSGLRKHSTEQPVACRALVKVYLQFVKESQLFYRQYISQLNATYGGIPELEAAAHQVKKVDVGESSLIPTSPDLRGKVLASCHQAVIYLGDLSRYRASEKLDKNPDFGPAIGFYGLACTLWPSSGLGHHQQAVIALDQHHHLRAIYHLYRAIVVEHPHPNAAQNLKREFDKINTAWDRGELIRKGGPNDPEGAKQTLTGWFVRLHSMCFKGEPFRGYDELEREVLGQLSAKVKQHDLGSTLMRMVMTNLSAELYAKERFQSSQTEQLQNAFLHFIRFNIKTYTTLLHVFYDELRAIELTANDDEDVEQLAGRLSDIARRILPSLRLYNTWLLPNTHLLEGLSSYEIVQGAIEKFWPIYAKVVDRVAATFPIWDLDDLPEITYMLEEDSDTLGFKPLDNAENDKNKKIWYKTATGNIKPRYSSLDIERLSVEAEMLHRVKDFLTSGLYLANDDNQAPLKLQATRVLHRDAQDVEDLPMPTFPKKAVSPAPTQTTQTAKAPVVAKPLSYAAAATNGAVTAASRSAKVNGASAAGSNTSRHAQLSRMVDDLVDDDESNTPITPPQQQAANPAIVTKGDVSYATRPAGAHGFARTTDYYSQSAMQKPIGSARGSHTAPSVRTPRQPSNGVAPNSLQNVSSLWDSPDPQTSHFPSGQPTGTLGSPAQLYSRGHSRVNSASSIRSRTSQGMGFGVGDSWSSIDSAPRANISGLGLDTSATASPLLFGAGGGVWSTSPLPVRRVSPPNGQGG